MTIFAALGITGVSFSLSSQPPTTPPESTGKILDKYNCIKNDAMVRILALVSGIGSIANYVARL